MLKENKYIRFIENIQFIDKKLDERFKKIVETNFSFDRKLVSFQANKLEPFYRWYKYKEAFSSKLVKYLLREFKIPNGIILDPFTGIGTTLFSAYELGYDSEGIELLPIGTQIIESRFNAIHKITNQEIVRISLWRSKKLWHHANNLESLNSLKITKNAYSLSTEVNIKKYLLQLKQESKLVQSILLTALLSILESVSFTRKDGQYLRWDYRSGRQQGKKKFDKGKIYDFDEAITLKLDEIIEDIKGSNKQLSLFKEITNNIANINLYKSSCLKILPKINSEKYTAIITSPPYCNRYDYTRTYALELALLGIKEDELIQLRQEMLSCTVENKEKQLLSINTNWKKAIDLCEQNELLQAILCFLKYQKDAKQLNNNGIPRMVKGYFYEISVVIQECYRVLKKTVLCL